MADRTVSVALRAEVSGYVAGMRQAAVATRGLAAETHKAAVANQAGLQDLSRAAAVSGAAMLAPLALATKAALGWETAWAGVTKTVNGSAEQMAALEGGLRDLATILPASHEEIAGVAEAAGQLGVARGSIVGFTKTMIDLGETTNLTAEEASTSIAQMMNVMQTTPGDVGRLGATLVALGNDGASTERDIVQMGQGIAGAAAVVGLSEGEVLAFANAVASMGIEVEAGGSAVSRVLTDMSKAAQSGGAELSVFAQTAGMSADEFSVAFQETPAAAFTSFIDGLAGIKAEGGNVFEVLDQIGLSDVRVSRAILGMASSGDLLTDSLALQATAWRDNTALIDEANKRYETTESRIQVARNEINDAAIDIGGSLLPAVAAGAESIGTLATSFAALPGPVKGVTTTVVGVTGATLLAAGAFGMVAPKIAATRVALLGMGTAGTVAARGIGMATAALGPLTAAFVVLSIAGQHFDAGQSDGFLKWMSGVEATAPTSEASIALLTARMKELQAVADEGMGFSVFGKDIKPTDWTGNNANAADQVDVLRKRIAELKLGMEDGGDAAVGLAGGIEQVSPAAADAEAAIKDYTDALSDMTAIDAYTSAAELKKAFRDLNKEIKDGGKVTNDEKIQLGGFARQIRQTATAVFEHTGSQKKSNEALEAGRPKLVALAEAAGYSKREARGLADELLRVKAASPTNVAIVPTGLESTIDRLATLRWQIDNIPRSLTIGVFNKVSTIPAPKGAAGGLISGPGSGTSDSIPAYISNGEYVVRAAAVQRYGRHFFDAANAMRFAGGGSPGHGAVATAAGVAGILARTPAKDSLEDIERAIRAVERLTEAYSKQQTMQGLNAKERRRAMADIEIAAAEERLENRRASAEERLETKRSIAANREEWEFDHLATADQIKNLDARIGKTRKFSDEWMDLQGQRESIIQQVAAAEKAAADAAAEAAEAAAEAAAEHAQSLVNNRASWEFDHKSQEQQVADLDARIGAEEMYSDTWLSLSQQREQITENLMAQERAAAEERARIAEAERQAMEQRVKDAAQAVADAKRVRDEYAKTVAATVTGFGAIAAARAGVVDDAKLAAAQEVIRKAQRFGTTADVVAARKNLETVGAGDPLSSGLIARTKAARLEQATKFVANIRTLQGMGLNEGAIREIIGMGPEGGAAYAQALVDGGLADISSINASDAGLAALGAEFGAAVAGDFYNAGINAKQGLLDGILSGNGVDDAMRALASQIVAGLTGALEIRSPSRLLARMVGRHIPGGVLMGARQAEPELRSYMREMASVPNLPRYSTVQASASSASGQGRGGPQFNYTLNAAPSVPTETQLLQMTAQSLALLNI